MERRTIKFNIKNFLEDYMYCIESEDSECKEELLEVITRNYTNNTNPTVKQGIRNYIEKSEISRRYPELLRLIDHF
jgi:hypothetical protein